jgi:hypothetical protein
MRQLAPMAIALLRLAGLAGVALNNQKNLLERRQRRVAFQRICERLGARGFEFVPL